MNFNAFPQTTADSSMERERGWKKITETLPKTKQYDYKYSAFVISIDPIGAVNERIEKYSKWNWHIFDWLAAVWRWKEFSLSLALWFPVNEFESLSNGLNGFSLGLFKCWLIKMYGNFVWCVYLEKWHNSNFQT